MEKQKSSKNTPNQQTREKIVNALLTLIKEKPLSTITITELTQLAGVSRMAFYRNFSTKEEVFSSQCFPGIWICGARNAPAGLPRGS